MKMKSVILFAVAIGAGLVAMLGVQKSLARDKGAKKEDTVKILVAIAEVEPGVALDTTNVAFKSWPKSTAPEGAVTKMEDIDNKSLRARAYAGDVIVEAKLKEGFGVDIPAGYRVATIPVDATKTHAGLMLAGNRVDVIVTYKSMKPNSRQQVQKTKTVLENIKVFATDNRRESSKGEAGENAAKTVSLLVLPEQANLLMLAESKGKLHLALRGDSDKTESTTDNAVTEDIFEDSVVSSGDPNGENPDDHDVRAFLEKAQEPTPAPAAPVAPVEVEKPKWKMSIHVGSDVKVEEVDLPEEPAPVSKEVTEEKSAPTSNTRAAIKDYIIKFFAGV
jgi:pilus assembly protein CpaB